MSTQFITFLEALKTKDNASLIDHIKNGWSVINQGAVTISGVPSHKTGEKDWFPTTIQDPNYLKSVEMSRMGRRLGKRPEPARTELSLKNIGQGPRSIPGSGKNDNPGGTIGGYGNPQGSNSFYGSGGPT